MCAGVGRCQGSQSCLTDGSGYDECDCSGPLRQPSTETTNVAIVPLIGRRCQADTDCGDGLRCFATNTNSLFGGGPAGGYCSVECTGSNTCTAIDPQSDCIGLTGTQSLCLHTCFSQDPCSPGPFPCGNSVAENKCLSRPDLLCRSEAALGQADFSGSRQPGWCFPQCGSDEDCPGRVCDLQRGLCVDAPAVGLPIGERCESRAQCAGGLCVAVAPGEQFCSAPCVLGQPVGCGYGPSVAQRDAACLGPLVGGFLSSESFGDTGFCAELCDVPEDCTQAATRGWTCVLSEGVRERFGRGGSCFPPEATTDAGVDGGSDVTVQDASTADGG